MKLIGYWIEDLKDLSLPHPGELVGEMPAEVRAAVCDYLSNGTYYNRYRGQSYCRFRCGAERREMGHREFTDGEWIWPEGLVHYVRHHGILLPDEFIAAATSGRSSAGLNVQRLMILNSQLLPYWIEWSAARQNPAYRKRLAAAVEGAVAQEPAFIEQRVASFGTKSASAPIDASLPVAASGFFSGRRSAPATPCGTTGWIISLANSTTRCRSTTELLTDGNGRPRRMRPR